MVINYIVIISLQMNYFYVNRINNRKIIIFLKIINFGKLNYALLLDNYC